MDQDKKEKSFRDTLNLPKTDFPIRANAKQEDAQILERWQQEKLFHKAFIHNAGKKKYILHDGPPYANGHIHIGHAYNKILKDIIGKSHRMIGNHVPIIPGWDCHGLPIEQKVTKELPNLAPETLKKECRLYAQKWIEVQKEEFKRLGVLMNWEKPYLTMNPLYEATIVRAFGILVQDGFIEKKKKTVPWCPFDQTVLATAEIEYKDRKDPSIYVLFDLVAADAKKLFPDISHPISLVVWTTTPWTLPLNRAVLLKPETDYALVKINDTYIIVGAALVDKILNLINKQGTIVATIQAEKLKEAKAQHPFVAQLIAPLITDPMVSTQEGTALVHCAPGCGPQDYDVALRENLEVYSPISSDGRYTYEIKPQELAGMEVSKGQGWVIGKLQETGKLLHKMSINHAYPHCWRCRNPLIFRATTQWFCNLAHNNLRQKSLDALQAINFYPPRSVNFLKATVEGRLEWCLSRQRVWGTPIPAVICKDCDFAYTDVALIEYVAKGIEKHGVEYWDTVPLNELPIKQCKQCKSQQLEKEKDILDVWFDAGISHYAVLYKNPEQAYPADMYLEGVDQHRGWFQSSLLTSMILEQQSCTKAFLTHGFVVDKDGYKMSKSLGNVVAPQELIDRMGTDGVRLWASSIDYAADAVVSDVLIENVNQVYRKIRNTCRFLLSNLYDFDYSNDALNDTELLVLDQYALFELYELNKNIQAAYLQNDFTAIFHQLNDYATVNLSQLYLDIVKDRLYVEKFDSKQRRSAQTAVYAILDTITKLMAPVLSFTAEQISDHYQKQKTESIHLQSFNTLHEIEAVLSKKTAAWDKKLSKINKNNDAEFASFTLLWNFLKTMRDALLKAIEVERQKGIIKHSLEARITIFVDLPADKKALFDVLAEELNHKGQSIENFFKEFLIVSQFMLQKTKEGLEQTSMPGIFARVEHAKGEKCPRCWQWHEDKHEHNLCGRCFEIVIKK